MVKTKKSKKGNKEDISDDNENELIEHNEAEIDVKPAAKEKKKSKKKKGVEDIDESLDVESAAVDNHENEDSDEIQETVAKKSSKKKKNVKKLINDDDEDDEFRVQMQDVSAKAKPNKKNKAKSFVSDEEDVDDEFELNVKSKKGKQAKPYSVFQLLDVEEPDEMDVDKADEVEDDEEKSEQANVEENNSSAPSKKSKKKKKKAIVEEEDEIERMLAELEVEYKGGKPKKEEKTTPEDSQLKVTEAEDGEKKVEEAPEAKKKKKKKKEKQAEDVEPVSKASEKVNEVEGGEDVGVKTAAQKKKEKKERDRLKKLEQNAKERSKQERQLEKEKSAEIEPKTSTEPKPEVKVEKEEPEEQEEHDDGDKKKDKKKKKDKEKDDKKRPGRKQVILMQEALKKLKEEEEKVRLEEEAKVLAELKAEELRLEKLRLEKERKEKKKLKEKERRERLKAEGKILSKTQKHDQARAKATLEALRAQGINVPAIGEKREKTARPGTKIRPSKNRFQKTDAVSENATTPDKNQETVVSKEAEAAVTVSVAAPEEIVEVKDSWDMSSDDESDKSKEVEAEMKDEMVVSHPIEERSVEEHNEDTDEEGSSSELSEEGKSDSESESEESESEESESSSSEEEEEEDEQKSLAVKMKERAIVRIRKRREANEKNRSITDLRSPIVCVLGHVDTGKTKILDKIRRTHVQDSEAGGITQQIGATMVPVEAINDQAKMVKNFSQLEIKLPGLLIIDTPGHESFSNLRSRGSSLCDIAILVVDLMHGLEPQTIESINLLKQKKTPFIVALNKIDRLYDWKVTKNKDVSDAISSQNRNTQMEFNQRTKEIVVQFAEQGLNAALFYENKDARTYVSMVPTSATTGEGMGNLLALVVELTQSMLAKRLSFSEELQATVLELKAIPGLGTTVDIILINGRLREGDTIVLAGMDGPVVTQIRSLLMPQPMKELRVKNPYQEFKEVKAAQGIKLTAKDLEKAVAGLNVMVAQHPDEVEILKELVTREFHAAMSSIKLAERGVYVQASTLGSLEALLEFLKTSKIPYSGIRIGPVVKRDVMKASIMLEHDSQYAVILAFDVKIERDAQELADSLGVKIFSADIIYHLFDRFTEYREHLKQQKRDEFKHVAVFPCKLRILPQFIFNTRDPIVVGVSVEAGVVREGTPICVPSQEFLDIGIVTTIEVNHKTIESARKGQEVCIKVEPVGGDAPKLYGRHFDFNDMLVSKISRESIDACKNYFRDDLQKTDWQLMIELKKQFQIL